MHTLSSSLFRLIFASYPSELKSTFGNEIVEVFLLDLSDAVRQRRLIGAISVWKRVFLELFGVCLPYQLAKSAFVAPVISVFWCSGLGIWLLKQFVSPNAPIRHFAALGWPGLIAAAISLIAVRHCSRPSPMRTFQFTADRA
jgi:hypothetical protein